MAIEQFDYIEKLLDSSNASPDRAYHVYALMLNALGRTTVMRCSSDRIAALELVAALTTLVRMFAQEHMEDPVFMKGFNLIGQRG